MPQLKREMSWLSSRRRRTTGNLKIDDVNHNTTNRTSGASKMDRPSNTHRPLSHPPIEIDQATPDGNLFYAYARKGDDINSRYLLTFASASIANEWWLLLQLHFTRISRPGPQLFSFQDDDLLSQAWKHASFAHLKSKWMFISFSESSTNGEGADGSGGAAAQSIIPVQDAQGNLLGSAMGNIDGILPELREEAQEAVRSEVGRLEEYVSNMMEALQRNTEKAAELAAKINVRDREGDADEAGTSTDVQQPVVDVDALSTHFEQLKTSLDSHAQAVEKLVERHTEEEGKFRDALKSLKPIESNNPPDMSSLTSHLDRIQNLMEESVRERKDSAREVLERAPQIDFSPLSHRLEKVQEAVEQNSALLRTLLEEGTSNAEAKELSTTSTQLDLTPLTDALERIHAAVEKQGEHTRALVGFASGENDGGESGSSFHDRNLTPLSEHLEQIYNAIDEGNKQAREMQPNLDLGPLQSHLGAMREQGATSNAHLERLFDSQNATRDALEANGGELDFTPIADRLDSIYSLLESQARTQEEPNHSRNHTKDNESLSTTLKPYLTQLQTTADLNAKTFKTLRDTQTSSTTKMQAAITETSEQIRKLVDRHAAHESKLEAQNSQMRELISGQRETVDVLRQLAKSIAAQPANREACSHVVLPPPRKMNRKLVGFVYDAKEGS